MVAKYNILLSILDINYKTAIVSMEAMCEDD